MLNKNRKNLNNLQQNLAFSVSQQQFLKNVCAILKDKVNIDSLTKIKKTDGNMAKIKLIFYIK